MLVGLTKVGVIVEGAGIDVIVGAGIFIAVNIGTGVAVGMVVAAGCGAPQVLPSNIINNASITN